MIVFCHLQYIIHHKVIYFTRELLVRPMGSISQIESAGHIRWKNRVCSFYQLNQTLDQGRVSTKTAYSLLHPPYQGYSQDAEGDANTNIHPKNMFPGIFSSENHICVISGLEQNHFRCKSISIAEKGSRVYQLSSTQWLHIYIGGEKIIEWLVQIFDNDFNVITLVC